MKIVNVPDDSFRVAIEFNRKEAEALFGVCGAIGGCSTQSPRGVFDQLAHLLAEAGIRKGPRIDGRNSSDCSLYFHKYND